MAHNKIGENVSAQTKCVNAGIGTDTAFGAVTPPLYLTSNYVFPKMGDVPQYDYGRGGNPNRDALAELLADMEGGTGGVVTSSGMAAIDLVLNLVPFGGVIVVPHDCYGGTQRLLDARAKQGRFKVISINQQALSAAQQIQINNPDMVLIETPNNPLMRTSDISLLTQAAHNAGAISVCDNTFLSPARQTPLRLGADIVLHSTTKFINGHSDVVGGAVIAKTEAHVERLAWWANCTGATGAPFDSFQTLRGLRTLFARMDAQEANAKNIVDILRSHKLVAQVYYPDDALASRQQTGPGAILSFEFLGIENVQDGIAAFLSDTGIFQFSESLGGTESLICHPATMTHRSMSLKAQQEAGIGENLIRMSIGLEHSQDQIAALNKMFENFLNTDTCHLQRTNR